MSEEIHKTKKKHRKGLSQAALQEEITRNVKSKSKTPDRRGGTIQSEKRSSKRPQDHRNDRTQSKNDISESSKVKSRELKRANTVDSDNKKRNRYQDDAKKVDKTYQGRLNQDTNRIREAEYDNKARSKRLTKGSVDREQRPKDKLHPKKQSSLGQYDCSNIKKCGGCQMQQLDYAKHLKEKQKLVESLIHKYCKVEGIIGMKNPYYYRNKVHAVFDHDRKGNPISGIYEEGTHRVIPIDSCIIEDQKADEIIVSIRGLLKSFKIKTYDEDTGYGLLRHVLIRKGFTSGEIMVVLVLSSPIFPSKNNFIKALRKIHPEITTIVLNVNDKKTSMVLGEKEHVIFGKGFIEDSLSNKVFRISPKSFYQVNSVQTEILYGKAIELAGFTGTETIIDAYCGIGTIGLIASDHVKKVIGVELNKDAVRDAIINAKRNQVKNIEFYHNDAGEFMNGMAAEGESVDVVFLDPPRAGSDELFLNSLVKLKPSKVLYISCNPVTLERDLGYLTKKGYRAVTAIPVDMFPWTEHVETCVLLTRKSAVDYNVEIKINL